MPADRQPAAPPPPPTPWVARAVGLGALLFGFATVVAGGRVLFGPAAVRAAAGQVVPFVLWFNFLAGFAYLVAGAGLALRQGWAARLSGAIAAATAFVLLAFAVHVGLGGAFEARTASALVLRTVAWLGVALWSARQLAG